MRTCPTPPSYTSKTLAATLAELQRVRTANLLYVQDIRRLDRETSRLDADVRVLTDATAHLSQRYAEERSLRRCAEEQVHSLRAELEDALSRLAEAQANAPLPLAEPMGDAYEPGADVPRQTHGYDPVGERGGS